MGSQEKEGFHCKNKISSGTVIKFTTLDRYETSGSLLIVT